MEPQKIIVALLVLAAGLLPGGCNKKQQSPPLSVPEVATVKVSMESVALNTELPGRTSAYLNAEIRPQVNGIIQKRLFTEGSYVRAGQVLYQIDPAPFQANLDNAKAAAGKAEANLAAVRSRAERFKELLPEKAVSQQDYDDAAAALKQTEADIEYWKAMVRTARINLGYTRITAPISGRIGKSNATEGALVTAQQPTPLSTIQKLDTVYVDVPQSTTELLRLKRSLE
ncbi:MAG TPA: efflux RND transporter periplasmic adaptor subunit, partial [Terriglobales bacterium]|nr:efflux RND transporter periplasmic adaptor subunit [Terriglobales bacterium]